MSMMNETCLENNQKPRNELFFSSGPRYGLTKSLKRIIKLR